MSERKETLIKIDKYVTKAFCDNNGLTNKHDRVFESGMLLFYTSK